jgi:hypothetical protein
MKASADRIKEIEAELHDLEARRQGLLAEMREIRSAAESPELPLGKGTPGTNEEKIDLFLSLFGARRSVYPKLWINRKKGSKGYSPACSNEWVDGVCEKPRVKCSDCPNQNFPPLDHSAIHSHLIEALGVRQHFLSFLLGMKIRKRGPKDVSPTHSHIFAKPRSAKFPKSSTFPFIA